MLDKAALGLTLAVLTSCTAATPPKATVQQELLVSGPEEAVRRFTQLQNSPRPALAVSAITLRMKGDSTATVALPADYKGTELIHTTREALAAGLSYHYRMVYGGASQTRW